MQYNGLEWGTSMEEYNDTLSINMFQKVIEILDPSMDDYLYIHDFKHDLYCISSSAVERFSVPAKQFHNVSDGHSKFIHPDDLPQLTEDIRQVMNGEKDFHDMEYRMLDREGNPVWINCRGQVIKDSDGKPEFLVGCINEIGKNQKADNVSGLLRESSLFSEITNREQDDWHGFMLRCGIDYFKEINENRGIDYGDMILRKTAECIKEVIEPGQRLYRIVADEFVIMDYSSQNIEDARNLYKKIRHMIDSFIAQNSYEVFYTISAGVLDLQSVEDHCYTNLMKLSEFALSEAKNRGKNQCCIFKQEYYNSFLRKRRLIQLMRQAVNHNYEGFETYFQPIMNVGGGILIFTAQRHCFAFGRKRQVPFHLSSLSLCWRKAVCLKPMPIL